MSYYAVIDTNVLVSGMLKCHSVPWHITNEALLGDIIPLLCDQIIIEYRQVLARDKFKFNQEVVNILIDGIIERGIFVDAHPVDGIIPDPKDIVFYEVVMEGQQIFENSYLVTGNIKHFPLKTFVVTPKEMLDIMHRTD